MKRAPLGRLAVLAVLLTASSLPRSSPAGREKISAGLASAIEGLGENETRAVWVFFADKGFDSASLLAGALRDRAQTLRERCQRRRSKVRPAERLVDFEDLGVFPPYAERVAAGVRRVRTVSRWLNALSVEATADEVRALARLESVLKLEQVAAYERPHPSPQSPAAPPQPEAVPPGSPVLARIYGRSLGQLEQINVPPLHLRGTAGRDVVVCLLDTGFRTSHPAFQFARLLAQWDFVNGDGDVSRNFSDPSDYSDSHGTGTWSALGGFAPGKLVGPAFEAEFILGKTETDRFERPIEEDYWVAGLEWAESLGADVVSSSLGYIDWYAFRDLDGKTAVTTRAADRAADLGVVVVNAAGNERNDPWGHIIAPADGFKVIAVGAVNAQGQIASFSSPGPTYDGRRKPEVCALGVNAWLADVEGQESTYAYGSGTSFATPLVAGVVALLLQEHPEWTPDDVRRALTETASRASSPDNDYGWGIVDAQAAAQYSASGGAGLKRAEIRK